jgi:hypothetical protein
MKDPKFSIITLSTIEGYAVKEKQLDGKKHLVVPVVMMVEGVHHGSRGPLLHKISELGKYPASWNGIPIVIDHPEKDGEPVSANSPDVLEARCVGRVFKTKVKGTKLKSEAWLEENKLRQVSSDTLASVKASEPVEVSVGVFSDEVEETGEWNGEEYTAVATNHRPDHLALLPGGTGACSLEDGCGIRANKSKKGGNNEMIRTDKIVKAIQSFKEHGFAMLDILDNTSEGLIERLEAVQRKVNSLDSNDSYHFVHEVYDGHVIYESRLRVGGAKIYKQAYSFKDGVVEFTGDPVEVHRKVEYIENNTSVNRFVRTKLLKKEVTMVCTECVKAKVDALIKANRASEEDREALQGLSETQLDKFFPKKEKPAVNEEEPKKETKKETAPAVEALSAEDKADLAWAKQQRTLKRQKLMKGIQDNTSKEMWPEETLKGMSEEMLERVYNSVKVNKNEEEDEEGDYSVAGNHVQADSEEVAPMAPAGIEFETKQK